MRLTLHRSAGKRTRAEAGTPKAADACDCDWPPGGKADEEVADPVRSVVNESVMWGEYFFVEALDRALAALPAPGHAPESQA